MPLHSGRLCISGEDKQKQEHQRRIRAAKAWITDLDGTLTILEIDWEHIRGIVRTMLNTDHPLRPLAMSIPSATEDPILRKRAYEYIAQAELEAATKKQRDEKLVSLVRSMRMEGLKLGVVTHQAKAPARLTLERLGVLNYFEVIVSREDALERGEQIGLAADALGVKPHEVIFTGDSPWDIEAGKRLGCFTVCVGADHPEADACIRSISELQSLIGSCAHGVE
jgi:HAD superfamily hydrolase (TIGR01509 family)